MSLISTPFVFQPNYFIKKALRNFYWATILKLFMICISISFLKSQSLLCFVCHGRNIGAKLERIWKI